MRIAHVMIVILSCVEMNFANDCRERALLRVEMRAQLLQLRHGLGWII